METKLRYGFCCRKSPPFFSVRWSGTAFLAGRIFHAKIWFPLQAPIKSIRFPKRKDGAQPTTLSSKPFYMALAKPYAELTHADKVYLLHSLFPQDVKAVVIFIADRIESLLQQPDKIMIDWEIKEGPSWPDILESLVQHIQESFDDLVENKYRFVNTFSKGYNQFFFLDCVTVYSCLCSNEKFRKALEFFFDL